MEKVKNSEKQSLIKRLINLSIFSGCGSSGGVGYHIKKLTGRDREVMEQLKEKDFRHRLG